MDRRGFLLGVMAGGAVALSGCASTACGGARKACCGKPKFRIGVAGITYLGLTLDQTLDELERNQVHGLCAKDFHFQMTAKPAELRALVRKCNDRGVEIYAAGPLDITDEDQAKRTFDYCAALGVKRMAVVPWEPREGKLPGEKRQASRRLCELTSRLAAEYDIKCGIHNHGKTLGEASPYLYGLPGEAYEMVKDLDPRLGLCFDVAYDHAEGLDPAEEIRKFADRIFDVHIRGAVRGPAFIDGRNCESSQGVPPQVSPIDYFSVFRALRDIGYDGWCGLEHYLGETGKDHKSGGYAKDPFWIPLSLGYFQGVLDSVARA